MHARNTHTREAFGASVSERVWAGLLEGQVVEAASKAGKNLDWFVGRKGTSADWFGLKEETLYLWGKFPVGLFLC